ERDEVDRITSLIQGQCTVAEESRLEVRTFRSSGDVVSQIGDASIVFVDYFLGPAHDQRSKERAVQRAGEITEEIYKHYAESNPPLVVLMSSVPEVREQQERFSRDKGWVVGLFYFVTKDD